MAGRFRGRTFRRASTRRRGGPETYTVVQCRTSRNIWTETTCQSAIVDAIPIFLPSPSVGSDATTAAAVLGQKAMSVMGIKFQSEFILDPGNALDGDTGLQPSVAAFILSVWEALVVLPLAEGTKAVPAYIPTLTAIFQTADLADRVLWKRISHHPFWGLQLIPSVQLQSTIRDTAHGPQVVKSNVRLDDRHGLFYVKEYVHDVVVGASDGVLPLVNDAWFKIFYKPRFR